MRPFRRSRPTFATRIRPCLISLICLSLSAAAPAAAAAVSDAVDAGERNFIELARALDAAAAGASGELADVARLLAIAQSRDAIRNAFRALLPELARHQVLKQQRAHRRPGRRVEGSRGTPILLASVDASGIDAAPLEATKQPRTGLWLQAWADRAEQDDRDDINGFESDTSGISIGLDRAFTENWTLGLSIARQTGDVDSERFGQDDLESFEVSAYTSLSAGHNVFSATLGFADSETDRERTVVITTDAGNRAFGLVSDVNSERLAGSLSWTGIYSNQAALTLSPFASVGFSRLQTDDYVESGAGNLSLLVETDDEDELIGSAGVSLGMSRVTGNWLLAPNVTVAFEHDFKTDATRTLSRFRDTRFGFESSGLSVEENRWRFSVGFQALHVQGFAISLALETHRKDDYHYDAAIIGVQTQF